MRSHSLQEKIHQLPESSSRNLRLNEIAASLLILDQLHCVEKSSTEDSLVQETSVCQRATNEFVVLVCCGRSSIAILQLDF